MNKKTDQLKITISGMGYVGLSNLLLLSRNNNVVGFDVDKSKISLLKKKISPIEDKEITSYLKKDKKNIVFTSSKSMAYTNCDIVFIATPTNYDAKTNYFDTSLIDAVIADTIKYNNNVTFVIRSTIPIGFVRSCRKRFNHNKIIFCPEFLREGKALYDSLRPSRIVVGTKDIYGKEIASLLANSAIKKNIPIIYTGLEEAESIKLFANSYLAMRVAYFNELDSYAAFKNLSSKEIISGISHDPRIGMYYNNPSFGYGGYCLPKDTKQLLANFQGIPNNLISAIVKSNETRKNNIVKLVEQNKPKKIGVYRMIMKSGSDNFRSAAMIDVIKKLNKSKNKIIIFEPSISSKTFLSCKVVNDLEKFKNDSDLILANRITNEIKDHKMIFTRDIFETDG